MATDEIKVNIFKALAEEMQKAIDQDILEELYCVSSNWTRVMLDIDQVVSNDIVEWLESIEHRRFRLGRIYFKNGADASWFLLRWS